MYALSTVWNAWRAKNGKEIIDQAQSMGFSHIELGSSLSKMLYNELKEMYEAGKTSIVSLHNYCPLPTVPEKINATPDMFLLSSPDEDERKRAVSFTKKTIDAAKDVGARVVVIHLGRVGIHFDGSRRLIHLLETDRASTKQFSLVRSIFLAKREKHKKPYLDAAIRSLEELNQYATKQEIRIGVENRYYLREIPSFDEIGEILDRFKGSNVFYWHDVGHAQFRENLGFETHDDYLKSYGDRIIGVHIHDIAKSDDHRAPLTGTFNFRRLKQYINKETIKVFEIHQPATARDIEKGLQFFKEEICPE
ncbi:MAG: sugar phosphate isomerase/epimerase family protein [Candidatus Ancaeobacter aquaticus]|nr:sugar phosphate isomerase/epimerase family protein [Candidatus Ancaeobacter aquaticus]